MLQTGWKTLQLTEQRVSVLPSHFPQVTRLVKKKNAADGSGKECEDRELKENMSHMDIQLSENTVVVSKSA